MMGISVGKGSFYNWRSKSQRPWCRPLYTHFSIIADPCTKISHKVRNFQLKIIQNRKLRNSKRDNVHTVPTILFYIRICFTISLSSSNPENMQPKRDKVLKIPRPSTIYHWLISKFRCSCMHTTRFFTSNSIDRAFYKWRHCTVTYITWRQILMYSIVSLYCLHDRTMDAQRV